MSEAILAATKENRALAIRTIAAREANAQGYDWRKLPPNVQSWRLSTLTDALEGYSVGIIP